MGSSTDLLTGRRREKRPKLVMAGSAFFGLLSAAAVVELARGAPLHLGAQTLAPTESLLYRASAAVSCAAIAGWIYLAGAKRTEAGER